MAMEHCDTSAQLAAHSAEARRRYHANFRMETPFGPCRHVTTGESMQQHDARLGVERARAGFAQDGGANG